MPTPAEVLSAPRTRALKADAVLADISAAGELSPGQAKTFIRTAIEKPAMMRGSRVVVMKAPTEEHPKIEFGSRVLRAASENVALATGQRSKPTMGNVTLESSEVIAEVRIPYAVLEDQIERERMMATILAILGDRVSLDLEELAIQGDTTSSDPYLALLDGWLALSTSNVYAHGGTYPDGDLFLNLNLSMPKRFRRSRRDMRHFVSQNAELIFRDLVSDRQTGVGDRYFLEDVPVPGLGSPLVGVDMMPDEQGAGSDESTALYTHPKNLMTGFWRRVMIETDKDIGTRQHRIVVTARVAFEIQEELAVVKGTGVLNQ